MTADAGDCIRQTVPYTYPFVPSECLECDGNGISDGLAEGGVVICPGQVWHEEAPAHQGEELHSRVFRHQTVTTRIPLLQPSYATIDLVGPCRWLFKLIQSRGDNPQNTRHTRWTACRRPASISPSFLPGDVIFLASRGDLPGRLGKWIAQSRGEFPTYAVHTAQFLDAHTILEMDFRTKRRDLDELLRSGRGFEVWRRRGLTDGQREALAGNAFVYLGTKFGWANLVTHALDGLINKIARKEVFFFRRLNHSDRKPICSWITAFAYDRVLHYNFGVPREMCGPRPDARLGQGTLQ